MMLTSYLNKHSEGSNHIHVDNVRGGRAIRPLHCWDVLSVYNY